LIDKNDAETEWRKVPTHQGGFLLDGGVHYVAGLRRLLESQPTNKVSRLSAFTTLLQEHLPPVDTINATLKLESGVSGTYQQSVGTSLTGSEWTVGCEHGVVTVTDSKVTVTVGGKTEEKLILDERTGVPPVVRVWGEAIATGFMVKDLEPEEALADLELVRSQVHFSLVIFPDTLS
jgi:predicted dehydrogenase